MQTHLTPQELYAKLQAIVPANPLEQSIKDDLLTHCPEPLLDAHLERVECHYNSSAYKEELLADGNEALINPNFPITYDAGIAFLTKYDLMP